MAKYTESTESDDAVIGKALRNSLIVILLVALVVTSYIGISRYLQVEETANIVEADAPKLRAEAKVVLPQLPLTDITDEAGIRFVHHNGAVGEKLLPETMGSGAAWLDYDNDGDEDLLFVNCKPWPWTPETENSPKARCEFYENNGSGKFREVGERVGLALSLYGMGAAVGDFNNDGWIDVFISAVGENKLMMNDSGHFVDVTADAGVAGSKDAWSTSSGMVDYDNDGLLDLFVCNYVQWSRDLDLSQSFSIDGQNRAYGPPRAFGGTYPYLYHNEGGGKFVDVSKAAGVQINNRTTGVPLAKGMGLAPIDVNEDGYIDFVVANDTVQNFLLVNQKDGTFKEEAELCGIAYDRDGNARGAMGIDAACFRDDGTLAISIGNFANEPTALYLASGPGQPQFSDLAMATGIGPQTRLGLTFGIFFADLDLDGRLDVVGTNGHLEQEINKVQRTQFYAQPPQVFWNGGREAGSQLIPLTAEQTGIAFHKPMVGRGAAFADIDNDGDLDFVFTASGGKPRLIRNDQSLQHHWLRFELTGKASNRSAIGATVTVKAGDRVWQKMVMPTRSYLSQSELPLTFGLGETDRIDSVSVRWPSGTTQQVDVNKLNQLVRVAEQ